MQPPGCRHRRWESWDRPLLLFASVAPLAGFAVRRLGIDAVALGVTVGLIAGIATRSVAGMGGLWAGTAVIGAAAAVGNVLIPVLVRRDYPSNTAMASGVSAMMLGGFAALGSGLTVVFAGWTGGWRQPLLLWAALPALVGVLWLIRRAAGPRMRGAAHARTRSPPRASVAAIPDGVGDHRLHGDAVVVLLPDRDLVSEHRDGPRSQRRARRIAPADLPACRRAVQPGDELVSAAVGPVSDDGDSCQRVDGRGSTGIASHRPLAAGVDCGRRAGQWWRIGGRAAVDGQSSGERFGCRGDYR